MNEFIARLASEMRGGTDAYVRRSEDLVGQIASVHGPKSIGMLLPLLDDRAAHDELMFSIIHTIESFDDHTYVRQILHHLPRLWGNSPRWATIIHMRILNSPRALAAYKDAINGLTGIEKQAVRDVLTAVRQKNSRFEASTDVLLEAL